MARYRIPNERRRVEYRHGNSRFIATVGHVQVVDEAKDFLRAIRGEMPDATHHVHAMKIGFGASVTEGMSDDGEPSGTSGPPILAILRGAELGDVIIVVTRYFGGTKLGTGGLVSAYSAAAKMVLDGLRTTVRIDRRAVRMEVAYPIYSHTKIRILEIDGLIDKETFAESVIVEARIPEESIEEFSNEIRDLSAGRTTVIVDE